ncbi:hypothetical protein [Aliivibrio fischeri]|uniref:hypothetical protein n=1 Tax=Aliivibrio fischeri TaxID=668 RepID=UPI0012DA39C3|nr:hypothetical protein [Aliivibrio fischeri]MCE7556440.1 hypothetical protein [Aliivibrio fischeri]MCE7562995.1 hypothetical protein [Aliivibrio fischeri]MCE7571287.1 hypothetical protein [Aliivibrio fischeri]MUL11864.1 hypothetical protein [Aliivibrio fischeri]MUL15351.1 hypothetical protein [Aliivibrio fischeri]
MNIENLVGKFRKVITENPYVFNSIVEPMRNEVDSEFESNKKMLAELKSKFEEYQKECEEDDEYNFSIDHYNDLKLDLMTTEYELEYLSQRNFVLREMQILYAYKNVEITLKRLISMAYPDTSLRELHNWKALKEASKNKGANLTQASFYQQIDHLRCVCNALKHSSKITQEVKSANIKEFNGKELFCDLSLGTFFDRVEPLISDFYISFCASLIVPLGGCKQSWLESFEPYVNPDPEIPF